ncbi:hypothetical protein ELJ53_29995, partial [Klebsiella pneumoniae]|nr:hypothetical protein [Klebsiella pneumoniae]
MSTTVVTENPPVEQLPAAEVIPAAEVAKPAEEKKPKQRKPREKKPESAKAPSHPPYFQMIKEAVLALNDKSGSSPQAIAKFIQE